MPTGEICDSTGRAFQGMFTFKMNHRDYMELICALFCAPSGRAAVLLGFPSARHTSVDPGPHAARIGPCNARGCCLSLVWKYIFDIRSSSRHKFLFPWSTKTAQGWDGARTDVRLPMQPVRSSRGRQIAIAYNVILLVCVGGE